MRSSEALLSVFSPDFVTVDRGRVGLVRQIMTTGNDVVVALSSKRGLFIVELRWCLRDADGDLVVFHLVPSQPDGFLQQAKGSITVYLDETGAALHSQALTMATAHHLLPMLVAFRQGRQASKNQPLVVKKRSGGLDELFVMLRLALAAKLLPSELQHEAERLGYLVAVIRVAEPAAVLRRQCTLISLHFDIYITDHY